MKFTPIILFFLTLLEVQAVTLVMDDRQPMPADASFLGKAYLWEVNRTSEFNLNHLLGKLTGDYDGVRYSAKFNDAFYVDVPGVDSVGLPGYKYLQNFYVEGTDSNTEIFKMVAVRAGISPPPTDTNRHDYILRTLNLDNIHLQVTDDKALADLLGIRNAMPELLIYDAINLNSSKLTMGRVTGGGNSPSELSFLGDHEINVTGTGNVIDIATATWNSTTVGNHSTSLNIADSSDLTIANGTDIFNEFNGNLSMGSGSTLTIDKSQVVLTSDPSNPKFKPSVIDNATVNITGTFGGSHASLQLTNPTIRNSTITLANNTSFRSYRRFTGGNTAGIVDFEGDNTINIGNGATFIGQAKGATTPSDGTFFFKNGTTTITGDTNANFQASDWFIDNATVNLNNISAETYVAGLTINNSTYKGRGFDFTNLSTLSVTDSTISGSVDFGKNVALVWLNNSSTIDPGFSTQSGGTEQYARGMTFNFAQAFWSGNNTFISNIDPNGTEVVAGVPATKNYSNALFIKRAKVTGFDTLNIVLNSADTSLLANDYALGGAASDGVYDLVNLEDGAKTDADNPTITLGGNMPVLLTATQVNTPSADQQVSVQLGELPSNQLNQHQNVQTNNHSGSASLVGNAAHNGNTTIQNALTNLTNSQLAPHLDSIHPEGYASHMTIGLEASLLALQTVNSSSRGKTFRTSDAAASLDGKGTLKKDHQKDLWADLNYVNGSIDEDGELGSIDYRITSFIFGKDLVVTHNNILGFFSGYSYYKMDGHGVSNMELDTSALYLGGYSRYSINDYTINSSIGYAYGMNESERDSTLGTISGTSDGKYDSHSFFIGSNAQKTIYQNKHYSILAELGMDYVYYYQEGFDESGNSDLDLSIDSADAQSLVNSIGLNIQFAELEKIYSISPRVYIRYEHDWIADSDSEHEIKASLKNSNSGKYGFAGQNRGADHFIGGFDLSAKLGDNTEVSVGSNYTDNDSGDEYGIQGRIVHRF